MTRAKRRLMCVARLTLAALLALAPSAAACTTAAPPRPADAPKPVVAAPRPPLCTAPTGLHPSTRVALPLAFDRFTADGKLRLVETEKDASGAVRVRRVAIADPITGAITLSRDARPHAIWLSTDGSIQLVWEPGALFRVDAAGKRTRVADGDPSSDQSYFLGGAEVGMSDDGRYFVQETTIRDVDRGVVAFEIPPVSAGGPNQRAHFVGQTSVVEACMRDCDVFDTHGAPRTLSATRAIEVGPRFDLAPAARDVLVMPHAQFARAWSPTLQVCSFDEKACRPKLALSIPGDREGGQWGDDLRRDYDAALCPTGDLAAVAWQGAIHFLDTHDGKERASIAVADAFTGGVAPTIRYAPGNDAIAFVRDRELTWMEPTF